MYTALIQNAALIIALTPLYGLILRVSETGKMLSRVLTGLLFGLVAVAGMLMPFRYAPGIIYDGRSIILSIAGLFGGGISAVVSMTIAGIYRAYIGGTGLLAGIATIIGSTLLGWWFRRVKGPPLQKFGFCSFFSLGLSSHILMLLCQLLLPWPTGLEVIYRIGIPVMLIFPLATVLLGQLLKNEESRLQTEVILRESEQKYRTLIDTMPDIVVVADYDGNLVFANPQFTIQTGFKLEELTPLERKEGILHPEDRARVQKFIHSFLEGENNYSDVIEGRLLDKWGHIHWFSVNMTKLVLEDTPLIQIIGRDITELKQAEIELQRSKNILNLFVR
ncbi:MAG: hypothetical protein Kow0042_28740 [Calditrichia bacterium]